MVAFIFYRPSQICDTPINPYLETRKHSMHFLSLVDISVTGRAVNATTMLGNTGACIAHVYSTIAG
jgi:hypothetical protein